MKVKDIMSPNPLRIDPNTRIIEVIEIFKRVNFWSIFIVEDDKLVGIVTRSDIRKNGRTNLYRPVSTIMTKNPYTIEADADAKEAAKKLLELNINSLAVTRNGKLCGVVTRYDIKTRLYPYQYGIGVNMDKTNLDEEEFTPFKEKIGFWDRILKNTDPIYWKKTIKKELDSRWQKFESNVERLEKEYFEFKKHHMEISQKEEILNALKEEWHESLISLENVLNKNIKHEQEMWNKTREQMRNASIKVKQKFDESDVDEIRFNSMMDYIKQYPELQAKSTINSILQEIKDKRKEIVNMTASYQESIKNANVYLNTLKLKLKVAFEELNSFEKMKQEAEEKVNNSIYAGFFGKLRKIVDVLTFRTEAEKEYRKIHFYEYDGKIESYKKQLEHYNEELDLYEKRQFMPIVTKKFKAIE